MIPKSTQFINIWCTVNEELRGIHSGRSLSCKR